MTYRVQKQRRRRYPHRLYATKKMAQLQILVTERNDQYLMSQLEVSYQINIEITLIISVLMSKPIFHHIFNSKFKLTLILLIRHGKCI